MARYRYLYTRIWQDPHMLKYSRDMKLFFIYLLTNPHTTQCGVYELPLELASVETKLTIEELQKLIEKLEKDDKVKYSPQTGEIAVKNWGKYNINDNPNIRKCVASELKDVKNKDLIKYIALEGFKISNKRKINKKPESPKENKKDYGDGVMLTEKEYSNLTKRFGKKEVEDKREDFANYEKREKYKNHYATILNWLKKDIKQNSVKEEDYKDGSYVNLRKELAK